MKASNSQQYKDFRGKSGLNLINGLLINQKPGIQLLNQKRNLNFGTSNPVQVAAMA